MNTDGISSRFGMLGPYAGTPLDDSGVRPRLPESRALPANPSAQLSVRARPPSGMVSLAQGIQAGVAVAQAGLGATSFLESAAARPASFPAAPPRLPDGGSGASASRTRAAPADVSRSGVPAALAELLAMAPQAADTGKSGSDLQAWLDIATGRQALLAAQEARARAEPVKPDPPADPPADPEPRAEAASAGPAQRAIERPAPQPASSKAFSEPPRREEDNGVVAALFQARRSFTAALKHLDARLEPALATAESGLGGRDVLAAAQSAADRMRRQPEQALETHQAVQLPGVLGLLSWDLTPLSEPLPEPGPG